MIQDEEDKNSDRTEDRESVTPSRWMKLALDKQSAATGSKAHHDNLKSSRQWFTIILRRDTIKNDPTMTRHLPIAAASQESEWRCLGKRHEMRVS